MGAGRMTDGSVGGSDGTSFHMRPGLHRLRKKKVEAKDDEDEICVHGVDTDFSSPDILRKNFHE